VVDLLIQQHNQIRDLFLEVKAASGDTRHDAFQRLVRLLAIHETAEEQAVHLVARLHLQGGGDIVDHRLAEEHQAKQTLAALEKTGPDAPEFPRLLDELPRPPRRSHPPHPHPGVESATANNLVGPMLSLFDRTKDLVRSALSADKR
jgi:hemerythrin HHE cation binding domain-containing protein